MACSVWGLFCEADELVGHDAAVGEVAGDDDDDDGNDNVGLGGGFGTLGTRDLTLERTESDDSASSSELHLECLGLSFS